MAHGELGMIEKTFGSRKPIIAMVHFPPLPGSPRYDAKGGMQAIIDFDLGRH